MSGFTMVVPLGRQELQFLLLSQRKQLFRCWDLISVHIRLKSGTLQMEVDVVDHLM